MKRMALSEAITRHVRRGMHLNFASTPSRSNAAIRELCRQFRGQAPGFELSATGFHSLAHLLVKLQLGRRYIACFFGDNYPTPRPNQLYRAALERGDELEHWSLWSYVSALRAGALGQPYAVTNSLSGTSLGAALSRAGKFLELPDPVDATKHLGLVTAIIPDLTFVHAVAADSAGNVLFAPPLSEGLHGALAAREGVIATVECVLNAAEIAAFPELIALPSHRILAVCEEPFGAHPQPLHFAPAAPRVRTYGDDYEHYELWRRLADGSHPFDDFERVLDAEDGGRAYREFVGEARLQSLQTHAGRARPKPSSRSATALTHELSAADRLILLAARAIARRVSIVGHPSILAGLGQAFSAVRLAKLLLGEQPGDAPEVMVETGFAGMNVQLARSFLLSQENVATAQRLGSVESMLGALTCGGNNRCLGVIGAAQVDLAGNVNSTIVDGQFLVGSGGASDIASSAAEVMVLAPCDPRRLLGEVEYITSPGHSVLTVVTDRCTIARASRNAPWMVTDLAPGLPVQGAQQEITRRCPWPLTWPESLSQSTPASDLELCFLTSLVEAPIESPSPGRARVDA
ncbi:MAG TPA: CoA-transferase [Polyangiaceae bacterium]|nr:CoA-transferase [Polyangiaceae bacterium]